MVIRCLGGIFIFKKILDNLFSTPSTKKEPTIDIKQLKEIEKQKKIERIKRSPLYMLKDVFIADEIQVDSRQLYIKDLDLEDNIILTPNSNDTIMNITDTNGNDIGVLSSSKATKVKNIFENECTKFEATIIEIGVVDGYYSYSFVVMSGTLKDQSRRFTNIDDDNDDILDHRSDWDDYDEDGTHYSDFPDKYGDDRD